MTLNDIFESGICVQGAIKVQCWESEVEPTVYYDGFAAIFYPEEYDSIMNREVSYMFAVDNTFCIEVCEE